MLKIIIKYRASLAFAFATSILFLVMMLVEQANGRFWLNDFKVFYSAAEALLNNKQVYGIPFGESTGLYKYSPFTLLFFAPYTLFPYFIASVIHFWVIVVFSIVSIVLIHSIISQYIFKKHSNNFFIYLATLVCIINHLIRELHLGNTNIILLFLLSLSLFFTLNKKDVWAGLILGVVIITKPYFLVLGLVFLLHKKWKIISVTLLSLIGYVLLTFLLFGLDKSIGLYGDWITSMSQHTGILDSSHTLTSLLNTYLGVSLPPYFNYIFFVSSCILFLLFFLIRKTKKESDFILFFYLIIASIPSLLVTDTEHFLFSMALIILVINFLKNSKNYLGMLFFLGLMVMFIGNWSDLWGNELSNKIEIYGILGISNILLISISFYLIANRKNSLIN